VGTEPEVYVGTEPEVYVGTEPEVYVGTEPEVYVGTAAFGCPASEARHSATSDGFPL